LGLKRGREKRKKKKEGEGTKKGGELAVNKRKETES